MNANSSMAWSEANQRHLMAALGTVREALERTAARRSGREPSEPRAEAVLAEAESAMPAPSTLERLTQVLSLTPFERDVLLLTAGPELDDSFAACLAEAHATGQPYPSFGLAFAALQAGHWSALLPAAPLRRYRLIELDSGASLMLRPLRIDERVLHYLVGTSCLDERLTALLVPLEAQVTLLPSHQELVARIRALFDGTRVGRCLVVLSGDTAPSRSLAAAAYRELGVFGFSLRAADIPHNCVEREQLLRLCERETALEGLGFLVEIDEHDGRDVVRLAVQFAEQLLAPVMLATREPVTASRCPVLRLHVRPPTTAEREALWRTALGPAAKALNGTLPRVTTEFCLEPAAIRAASADALLRSGGEPWTTLPERLWEACRAQSTPRLDELAQHIASTAKFDDLVLPKKEKDLLRLLCSQVRHRSKVYETWGFAELGNRGLGISALFAGQSGTGKTLAAEAIASELELDLYRIDLSGVVSKYIGETEKNLRRIFDAAEAGGVVLLFDEADALFGKRSEVKDSHDRYANIEVSYLLQRMEAYRGLAILTTNLKSSIDTAFLRRLRFVVDFPFPDARSRAVIWVTAFPTKTPTDGLKPERLAQLNVAGGNIRNIALGAAFLAAEQAEPVRMAHVLTAAQAEYRKLGRSLTDVELRGWS